MRTLLLLVVLCLPAPARDVLLPGHRAVSHTIVLEGDAAGHRLVAAPTAGFAVQEVAIGEPFRFSSKYGTRLWAFAQGTPVPERWDAELFAKSALVASLPPEIASVPVTSSLRSVQTTLRVDGLASGRLALSKLSEVRDPPGASETLDWRFVWIGIAALGLVLAIVLRWRRRRRETPEA